MIELKPKIQFLFAFQAEHEYPREACGLLAVINGKQEYYPCKNNSKDDQDFFIAPEEYVRIEDLVLKNAGEIVAVIHSHPVTTSAPSLADKAGCESSGLPWLIYSVKERKWNYLEPSGFKAPLIGRAFKHGIFDCYSAMRDWYKEKLSITLKDFERDESWWEKGQNLFLDNFESAGFKQVLDGTIKEGDIVLMNIASPVVNHCAVYIGKDQIFHQTIGRLSSREVYGGMWKKNTRMILRYSP